jgi:hypothetical protein
MSGLEPVQWLGKGNQIMQVAPAPHPYDADRGPLKCLTQAGSGLCRPNWDDR